MGPCNSTHIKANFPPSNYILPNYISKKLSISNEYILSNTILGKGTYSTVIKATEKATHKQVAIKIIDKTQTKNVVNILEEALIHLNTQHHNIVKCESIYENKSSIYFVLELINGNDLLSYIINSPNHYLSEAESIELLIQLLKVINYLHEDKRIVHRDLKPQNVLVYVNDKGESELKVIDFGYATKLKNNESVLSDFVGSPIYTAPEIIKKDKYKEKIDMWSIGVILFNMLTGFQPFDGNTPDELDNAVIMKDIYFKAIKNKQLRKLCMGLLEKDPDNRWDSSKALNEAERIKNEIYLSIRNDNANSKLSTLTLRENIIV